MMSEACERQWSIVNGRYMRGVQHRTDLEYQIQLRRQEKEREELEEKREQCARQRSKPVKTPSIYSMRTYDRPWAVGMAANRKVSATCKGHLNSTASSSSSLSQRNKTVSQLPLIVRHSNTERRKVAVPIKKQERNGVCLNLVSTATQRHNLPKRNSMTHRRVSKSSENLTTVAAVGTRSHIQPEEIALQSDVPQQKGKQPLKQKRNPSTQPSKYPSLSCQMSPEKLHMGCSEGAGHGESEGCVQQNILKKSSSDQRSSSHSPKLDLGHKESVQGETNRNSHVQTNLYSPALASSSSSFPSTFQGAVGPVSPAGLTSSYLSPHHIQLSTAASFRYRDEDFYSSLDSDFSEALDTDEGVADNYDTSEDDQLYCSRQLSPASLSQGSTQSSPSFSSMSCSPDEISWHALPRSVEEETSTLGASRTLSMLSSPLGHSLLERRRNISSFPRNQRRNCDFLRNPATDMENNEYIEYRNLLLSPRRLTVPNSEDGDFIVDNLNNNQTNESEVRSTVSHERDSHHGYFDYTAVRLTGLRAEHMSPRPFSETVGNTPRNSGPLSSPLQSSYLPLDINRISRFGLPLRPLSPIGNRNVCSISEDQEPSLGEDTVPECSIAPSGSSGSDPSRTFPVDNFEVDNDLATLQPNSIAHLEMPGTLRDRLPLALLAMSELRSQASILEGLASLSREPIREENRPAADPEKLKRIQESLLQEDSEEEGDLCRICHTAGGTVTNPLLEPCKCVGSLQFVHQECLKRWLQAKITSGAELSAVQTCELCKQDLKLDFDDFDVDEFYRKNRPTQTQEELVNSGLYLVLLLHLYEQRFAELMRITRRRATRYRLSRNDRHPVADEDDSSDSEDNENSADKGPDSVFEDATL
ncbi:probable E3 ubiquitin-protein ligase MARCHF10 [Protopterus annectens]|uniref:probable E3 ubiquitin-protein ligase MARCHF10 n=1 Tax=Protopterus annectens TaxID=7888 RepID=UPI001CFA156E|nr:probable E3 ubiquitin-protein ligase MARCHF10 [Protopterus annectens]XP_043911149.1 probable E3 ubiquitin-protein ligase MARCHF10 [Protopterus annectens]